MIHSPTHLTSVLNILLGSQFAIAYMCKACTKYSRSPQNCRTAISYQRLFYLALLPLIYLFELRDNMSHCYALDVSALRNANQNGLARLFLGLANKISPTDSSSTACDEGKSAVCSPLDSVAGKL